LNQVVKVAPWRSSPTRNSCRS